ncbi:hypothetical protein [Fowlpox virus]|uniref:ORF FPV201 n=9 Tax=Fowlpox virus TaxID=10261 RepID=Q77NS8_FOWPN|nr:hypothetical protein FPV201 [Fowlpox virus]UNS14431.1 ALPV-267 [Albatrosspox virus]WPD90913.1 MC144-like hypothetical protein [Avipoxvirus sp.]CAE52739.1 hypothetical protein [Fowlpox virus isolate HP-438/Munich]AAC58235.1 hypothetical protein [Fowlpox virus]AAC58238.1 hypothetical protein [Fowlpox virus]
MATVARMYKTINTTGISCVLKSLIPDSYNEEYNIDDLDLLKIKEFIEISMQRCFSIKSVTDSTVLYIENRTNRYSISTSHDKNEPYEENGIIMNNIECYFVACLEGSCTVNVNLGDRQISDNISESSGFLMDVNTDHVIDTKYVGLFITKIKVDAHVFYGQNVIMFPEKNLFSQTNGPNFILYDITVQDRNVLLLITSKYIYNLCDDKYYDIFELKYLVDNCKLPMPLIPLSKYDFTFTDLSVIKSENVKTVLSKVHTSMKSYYNNDTSLPVAVKVIYGTVTI